MILMRFLRITGDVVSAEIAGSKADHQFDRVFGEFPLLVFRRDLGYVLQEVEVFQVDGATAGVSRVRATTEVITCGITSRLNVCDPSTI